MANGSALQVEEKARKLTPAQRNLLFASATRKHLRVIPAKTGAPGTTLSFEVPKVRLTEAVRLLVEATLTATHASNTTYTPATHAPFTLLKNVRVNINNGFNPYQISGLGLYMLMLMRADADTLTRQTSGRGRTVQGDVSSAGGTANTVRFVVDLPLALNDRDPVGLVLTQNQETTVTVEVDLGTANDIAPAASGYTFALSDVTVTPLVESFTVPAVSEAFPDISIVKLVNEKIDAIAGAGPITVRLPVGTTYRKLIFFVADSSGAGVDITSNIEIALNQSDTPIQINPKLLAAINHELYATPLPTGMYALDLASQGFANYGGSRDYIDTERLTEFWLRFDATAAGSVRVVYEHLSRLR